MACVQSVWDDWGSKTWDGSRCEIDACVVKGEIENVFWYEDGLISICAQVSERESDDNRTIPGCMPQFPTKTSTSPPANRLVGGLQFCILVGVVPGLGDRNRVQERNLR